MRHLDFLLLLAVSLVIWWHPLVATFGLALGREEYTHILLILPMSGGLMYLRRKDLPVPFKPSIVGGLALLIAGVFVAAFAKWGASDWADDQRLSLFMFAVVLWWIGSVVFCFGTAVALSLLFPLCFLFWIIPLPEVALSPIVQFLQHQSAFAARLLFRVVGTPATQDGIMLSIPGLDIEVARECSSIRSSLILVVTTMFMAPLFLRAWWRKVLLILAAIPLSVMKNGLRIVVISELGTRVDPGFLDGRLHHHGGIVFLAVAQAVVIGLLWILVRTENVRPRELGVSP